MEKSTLMQSRRRKQVNPHAKTLSAIRARRLALQGQPYVARRRDFATENLWKLI